MKYDIFLSICQTEVDQYTPSESEMFKNFFDQVILADQLGFGTAWVAETHLSCQTQKQTSNAVVPQFQGEIGLNTDILQLAHMVFARTQSIQVGSAIRNILCNGGPIAHAEGIRSFLKLNEVVSENRKLCLGFASGRFDFANEPYGIRPRNSWEKLAWPALKGKILMEATEIFLRFLKGETLSSSDIISQYLTLENFRNFEDWEKFKKDYEEKTGETLESSGYRIPKYWEFEILSLIPQEVSLKNLELTIGTHDPQLQEWANQFLPVSVFNLSITPQNIIEQTHERMRACYHPDGGEWSRTYMPRTALVFIDQTEGLDPGQQNQRAQNKAEKAWSNYWKAMKGTLDPEKVKKAVTNAIYGNCQQVAEQIKEKYDPQDRLMLWFDFNNHDNEDVKQSMELFMSQVVPLIDSYSS